MEANRNIHLSIREKQVLLLWPTPFDKSLTSNQAADRLGWRAVVVFGVLNELARKGLVVDDGTSLDATCWTTTDLGDEIVDQLQSDSDSRSDRDDPCVDLFKNACRIHTDFMIARYLMSNTKGCLDGAEKAQRHIQLCQFYVAAFRGYSDPDRIRREFTAAFDGEEDFQKVHERTQELTDHLDRVIGFPVNDVRPDYDKFVPLFFEKFHELALKALRGDDE